MCHLRHRWFKRSSSSGSESKQVDSLIGHIFVVIINMSVTMAKPIPSSTLVIMATCEAYIKCIFERYSKKTKVAPTTIA